MYQVIIDGQIVSEWPLSSKNIVDDLARWWGEMQVKHHDMIVAEMTIREVPYRRVPWSEHRLN